MNNQKSANRQSGVLGKNTFINFMGQAIPLVFAIIAIPFVIKGLGTERFGILMTIWVVTGYFSLFDMGLGRATTKFVADQDAESESGSKDIIITSILLLLGVGILGSLTIILLTKPLVNSILNIPTDLILESEQSFYILSLSIPFVLASMGARGVLEARQKFGIVNAVKIPASLINYVGPVPVLLFTNSLVPVVILLIVARIITFFIYLYFSLRDEEKISLGQIAYVKWGKKLISFGAWLTVSNLISPIMSYMDRFIVGALLTMTAVTYYTTPYEVVSRLLIIPGSFMAVMFPAFSVYASGDSKKFSMMFNSSIRYLLVVMTPIVVIIIISSETLLYLWLGSDFADNSAIVLQVLALGMLINSLAMVPYSTMQAYGRPDIIAKIHMIELPVYLVMIWYFTIYFGIAGVAMAWTIRVAIDCVLMFYFYNKVIDVPKSQKRIHKNQLFFYLTAIVAGYLIYLQLQVGVWQLLFALVSGLLIFGAMWKMNLDQKERNRLKSLSMEVISSTKSFFEREQNGIGRH
jgi:O-antigen/teichoic acid export membrane protein